VNTATEPLAFQPRPAPQLPQNQTASLEQKSRKYHPNYSLDILQSEVAFGPEVSTSLGAIVALTDTFSDRRIAFILGSAAQSTQDFLSGLSAGVAYSDLSNRVGWEVAAFRFVESSSIWSDRLYDEVRTGGELAFSYPFNSMQMISLDLVSWFNERIYYNTYRGKEGSVITEKITKDMTIGGAYITASNDTTLWQVDGPIDGNYTGLTVGGTRSLSEGGMLYFSLFPDWRNYVRLGKSEALAFRLVSWQTFGREALPFIFGGSLSMRGWNWLDFVGTRMAMGNAELRFNLADQVVANTLIGELGAIPLRGALFIDAGEAWDDELPDHFRTDAGFGFRWALGGVLVLRFDWAKRATIYYGGAATRKGAPWVDFKQGFPFQFFVGWSY
jgi:outer membrane protein assembly factor BamA